jgi:hypothetical protein
LRSDADDPAASAYEPLERWPIIGCHVPNRMDREPAQVADIDGETAGRNEPFASPKCLTRVP